MIREATQEDIVEICRMLKPIKDEVRVGKILNYSTPGIATTLAMGMESGKWRVFVNGDPINGVLAGSVGPSIFDHNENVGSCVFIYVSDKGKGIALGLREVFEQWCKESNCKLVKYTCDNILGKQLKKDGFDAIEKVYVRAI